MSINAVSSSQAVQAISAVVQDVQKQQKALAAGNISGVEADFRKAQKELPSFGGPKGPGVGNSQEPDNGGILKVDLQNLQNALAAGDVAGAQNAFSKLKADLHEIDPPRAGVKISASADGGEKKAATDEKVQFEPASSQQPLHINVFA